MNKDIYDKLFWEVYPEMKYAPVLDEFYKKDKSKGKSESSKIMWAIDMCEKPDSMYYNRPNKYEDMIKTFLKEIKNFKWSKYEKHIDSFKESALSDAERGLSSWNEIIRMRDTNLKKLYKDLHNVDVLELDTKALKDVDAMLALTPKLYDDYNKIKATYEEEKIKKKGSTIASLSDSNDI